MPRKGSASSAGNDSPFNFFRRNRSEGEGGDTTSPQSAFLSFRNVTWKADDGSLILDGISGMITPGEVTAIMGPSVRTLAPAHLVPVPLVQSLFRGGRCLSP